MTRVAPIGLKLTGRPPPKAKRAGEEAEEGGVAEDHPKTHRGHCLCGDVSFSAKGLSDIWYCHCKQCQHLTGLYIAAAGVERENLHIVGPVNWLPISEKSESGQCQTCGSYMFWNNPSRSTVSVLAGNIDDTAGLEVKGHIYVSQKGRYYEITDGLPQFESVPEGTLRT